MKKLIGLVALTGSLAVFAGCGGGGGGDGSKQGGPPPGVKTPTIPGEGVTSDKLTPEMKQKMEELSKKKK